MVLTDCSDGIACDLVIPLRFEGMEKNLCSKGGKRDRKTGGSLLVHKRLFDVCVAAVNMDSVSGTTGRNKKWKALDVVPVEVRKEKVKYGRRGALSRVQKSIAEIPEAGSCIAQDELFLSSDLHAGGVSPAAPTDGKGELLVDKVFNRLIGCKVMRP